jgi:alanyl-tRNA synthetase
VSVPSLVRGDVTSGSALQNGAQLNVNACVVAASYVLHKGTLSGKVAVGDSVKCLVDWQRRAQIIPNHTMTHVLNHALRHVCGDHVDQKGSDVQPEKLTFDFSNNGPVTVDQLKEVQVQS